MSRSTLQYLADEQGDVTAVVVPIGLWREIEAELETQHLLRSPAMRERLRASLRRSGGHTLDEVLEVLGISDRDISEGAGEAG
jgi:hypothetical protein